MGEGRKVTLRLRLCASLHTADGAILKMSQTGGKPPRRSHTIVIYKGDDITPGTLQTTIASPSGTLGIVLANIDRPRVTSYGAGSVTEGAIVNHDYLH
ncbi:hypothetical protein ES703_102747 [subsurface metagenome]